jgi:hypothetical protein
MSSATEQLGSYVSGQWIRSDDGAVQFVDPVTGLARDRSRMG